ncbi:MAG: dihydroorotate dehydrogenase electron transfer subunit [Lachnospiraceae bacterium]|nr:dihydroorotate dehydrogenase electron transfer subunit [Lachnospiraceae bacterium]
MKRKTSALIKEHREIASGVYSLILETMLAVEAEPGQFAGVYLRDGSHILMRPISICDAAGRELRMVYRTAGAGTKELSTYRAGESVDILGMLGNGYDMEKLKGKNVLALGGGIGIPPMLYLVKTLKKEGIHASAVLGYADNDTFLKKEFEDVCDTYAASMDGSIGTKGTVLDAIKENGLKADVICACGPMPMLAAVKKYAEENGMEAYISLEERMACGVGACLGCVTKTVKEDHHTHVNNTRICVEGPVFDAKEVCI